MADRSDYGIDWNMEKENDATAMVKRDPRPAFGGPAERYIHQGNFVTLAEVLYKAIGLVSCFGAEKLYFIFPVWCYKRQHSVSHCAQATMRRNAQMLLQYLDEGRWGTPTSR